VSDKFEYRCSGTGSCPFKALDDIIVEETLSLSCPWTHGQGDRTSPEQRQRFEFDPDLLYFDKTPEWARAYDAAAELVKEYWHEYHKTLNEVEGPNRPLVRLGKEPTVPGKQDRSTLLKGATSRDPFRRVLTFRLRSRTFSANC
jgi:hypothetical protein